MDDETDRGELDRSRRITSDLYEVQYGSQKFGVSADELKLAVTTVRV